MKRLISLISVFTLVTGLIIAQTGCSGKTVSAVSKTGYYFDTVCQIDIYDMENMSEEAAGELIDEAFDLCDEFDSLLSRTKPGSDVYRVNNAGGEPVECDGRTVEVIKKGIEYGELSDGKFDITMGRLSDLWQFDSVEPVLPSEGEIEEAVKTVDYTGVEVDGNTVTLKNPEAHLDLGGIAKGYIADKVSEFLRSEGVTSAIVNLGGNIEVIGYKGDDEETPLNIGIKKPYGDEGEIVGSVKLHDATIVTSGIYERFHEIDGKKYHHILDRNTGYPAETDVDSVSIVSAAGRSVDCDGLSTICLILGVDKGLEFIESMDGVEAIFVDSKGEIHLSSGLEGFEEA